VQPDDLSGETGSNSGNSISCTTTSIITTTDITTSVEVVVAARAAVAAAAVLLRQANWILRLQHQQQPQQCSL